MKSGKTIETMFACVCWVTMTMGLVVATDAATGPGSVPLAPGKLVDLGGHNLLELEAPDEVTAAIRQAIEAVRRHAKL